MKKKINSGLVVWVDVDEVIFHFRRMFNEHLRKKYKLNVKRDFISTDWYYSDVVPKELVFMDLMNSLPENWTENQKIYVGAKKFMETLRKMGCYIVIITHVPQEQSHYRIKNLVKHGIHFDEIYFTGISKTIFSEEVVKRFVNSKGKPVKNFFIDDRAKNVVEFLENMPNVVAGVTLNVKHNEADIKRGLKFKDKFICSAANQQEMYQEILKALKKHT